jgi:hypothetical protein
VFQAASSKEITGCWGRDNCGSNPRIVYPDRSVRDWAQLISMALADEITFGRSRMLVAKLAHSSEVWNPADLNKSCETT